jgi:hypothetical protein
MPHYVSYFSGAASCKVQILRTPDRECRMQLCESRVTGRGERVEGGGRHHVLNGHTLRQKESETRVGRIRRLVRYAIHNVRYGSTR